MTILTPPSSSLAIVWQYKELGKLATNNNTNIDYTLYSAKFNAQFNNGINLATGLSKYSDGAGQSETLGIWGGYPSYTTGFIYNFFETGSLQNSLLYKVQVGFDLEKLGINDTWIGYRYIYYDLGAKYCQTTANLSISAIRKMCNCEAQS